MCRARHLQSRTGSALAARCRSGCWLVWSTHAMHAHMRVRRGPTNPASPRSSCTSGGRSGALHRSRDSKAPLWKKSSRSGLRAHRRRAHMVCKPPSTLSVRHWTCSCCSAGALRLLPGLASLGCQHAAGGTASIAACFETTPTADVAAHVSSMGSTAQHRCPRMVQRTAGCYCLLCKHPGRMGLTRTSPISIAAGMTETTMAIAFVEGANLGCP